MSELYLYNTRAGAKELFTPLRDNEVRMYNCGPTVYGIQHIGNLRAFVIWDILRRTLEYNGYNVKQVINITDVGHLVSDEDAGEDKMSKGLRQKGWDISLENMLKLGREYEEVFISHLQKLNIKQPEVFPRASEHIQEDIDIIQTLLDKEVAYITDSGVYFDTSKDVHYGKALLRTLTESDNQISENNNKRNVRDFALWKFNESMGWDTPWGKGFPGWHIECSAMSEKYLDLPFDIHTGGIEHIPIHHTNEIAQSENARDVEMARFWLHNNHLQVGGEKISKSLGNTIYLDDIEKQKYSPLDLRFLFLGAHYKRELNFTWEALEAAATARKRLSSFTQIQQEGSVNEVYKKHFLEAINDDLNTPQALAVLWDVARDESLSEEDKKSTLLNFDTVLGVGLGIHEKLDIPDKVKNLVEEREKAREEKDFNLSDTLRNHIQNEGFDVQDTKAGPRIVRL